MELSQKIILYILAAIAIVLAFVAGAMYVHAHSDDLSDAPSLAVAAQIGEPANVPTALDYRKIKMSDAMSVGLCGNLTPDANGQVQVYFTNYSTNNVWMSLVAYIDGVQVGQTDAIEPDTFLEYMQLDASALPDNTLQLELKLVTYESNTYYSEGSAIINTILNPKK